MDAPFKPPRAPWDPLPDLVIFAAIPAVKQHPAYPTAKVGDADAALALVQDLLHPGGIARVAAIAGDGPGLLVPVHAYEREGVNAIPVALARQLQLHLGPAWTVLHDVVQSNVVSHTGAGGFDRLRRQAAFEGAVRAGRKCLLVDDFIGQGGTLANLRGHLLSQGAHVVGGAILTGKEHSAPLALNPDTLDALRRAHGRELEAWWLARFGHAFDGLTESEARYLLRTPDAQRVRDRVAPEEPG